MVLGYLPLDQLHVGRAVPPVTVIIYDADA
jgi:hypothetical protein